MIKKAICNSNFLYRCDIPIIIYKSIFPFVMVVINRCL